ncbi:MAG TPA: MT-A70 family methyltransferase, partial [Bauldia sp.]|nr:MT-A70 family methyltransferase [Bauldia sp.]
RDRDLPVRSARAERADAGAGRSQVNVIQSRKREHSRKPDEQYEIIEKCSPGPYLELFARGTRPGWTAWGRQAEKSYAPTWDTYAYNSAVPAE